MRLVCVVDRLLTLSSHLSIDLAEHLLAHHVGHHVTALSWHSRHRGAASHRDTTLRNHWLSKLLPWLDHGPEDVDIVRVVHVVKHIVSIPLTDTVRKQPVLALVEIKSHLLQLLQEALLLLDEIWRDHAWLAT